jgi:hypothetical protein
VTRRMPRDLPVTLAFEPSASREAAWGRLESLSPAGASLLTLARLSAHDRLQLSFEVNGERFEALDADVARVELDPDGYTLAELDFARPTDRRRLSAALLDALSR